MDDIINKTLHEFSFHLAKTEIEIFKQAGFHPVTGEACPTYAHLARNHDVDSSLVNKQGKCDILIYNWDDEGRIALFDVGVCHVGKGGVRGGEEGDESTWATRMAREKAKAFDKNVTSQISGVAHLVVDSWRFIPLCADTAGAWAAQARHTLQACAAKIDESRRGHVVGVWWQMLSTAVQKEHHAPPCVTAQSGSLHGGFPTRGIGL